MEFLNDSRKTTYENQYRSAVLSTDLNNRINPSLVEYLNEINQSKDFRTMWSASFRKRKNGSTSNLGYLTFAFTRAAEIRLEKEIIPLILEKKTNWDKGWIEISRKNSGQHMPPIVDGYWDIEHYHIEYGSLSDDELDDLWDEFVCQLC